MSTVTAVTSGSAGDLLQVARHNRLVIQRDRVLRSRPDCLCMHKPLRLARIVRPKIEIDDRADK